MLAVGYVGKEASEVGRKCERIRTDSVEVSARRSMSTKA
jgi:hypothetical protein